MNLLCQGSGIHGTTGGAGGGTMGGGTTAGLGIGLGLALRRRVLRAKSTTSSALSNPPALSASLPSAFRRCTNSATAPPCPVCVAPACRLACAYISGVLYASVSVNDTGSPGTNALLHSPRGMGTRTRTPGRCVWNGALTAIRRTRPCAKASSSSSSGNCACLSASARDAAAAPGTPSPWPRGIFGAGGNGRMDLPCSRRRSCRTATTKSCRKASWWLLCRPSNHTSGWSMRSS